MSTGQESDSDPAGEYATRAVEAETRREAAYWDLHFFVYVLVYEEPAMLKQDISRWLSWRLDLLRGGLPQIGEECHIKNCQRESVAHLPDNKSYTDGTPVCRRHYLTVKSAVYGFIAVCLAVLATGAYVLVIA